MGKRTKNTKKKFITIRHGSHTHTAYEPSRQTINTPRKLSIMSVNLSYTTHTPSQPIHSVQEITIILPHLPFCITTTNYAFYSSAVDT